MENKVFCPRFHGDNQTPINEHEMAPSPAEFSCFETITLEVIRGGPLLVFCDAFQGSLGDV